MLRLLLAVMLTVGNRAAGGSFGFNFELPCESSICGYYRTKMCCTFDAQMGIDPPGRNRPTKFLDINFGLTWHFGREPAAAPPMLVKN